MRIRSILGGIALAAALAASATAADAVKIGFITKFPVPFFATMENAAKAYAAAHPGVEIIFGQGTSATDIEGQIALIEFDGHKRRAGHRHHSGRSDGSDDARQGSLPKASGRPHGQEDYPRKGADRAGDHENLEAARSPRLSEDSAQNGDTLGILKAFRRARFDDRVKACSRA